MDLVPRIFKTTTKVGHHPSPARTCARAAAMSSPPSPKDVYVSSVQRTSQDPVQLTASVLLSQSWSVLHRRCVSLAISSQRY